MRNVARSLSGSSQRTAAHQELALAVIVQAIADATKPEGKLRHEARHFLKTDAMLAEWCGVAGLDPEFVKGVIRRSIGRRRPRRSAKCLLPR